MEPPRFLYESATLWMRGRHPIGRRKTLKTTRFGVLNRVALFKRLVRCVSDSDKHQSYCWCDSLPSAFCVPARRCPRHSPWGKIRATLSLLCPIQSAHYSVSHCNYSTDHCCPVGCEGSNPLIKPDRNLYIMPTGDPYKSIP